jgi:hypothetical protein
MVLNDGETYTGVDGCKVVAVNSDFDEQEIEMLLARLDDPAVVQNSHDGFVVFRFEG